MRRVRGSGRDVVKIGVGVAAALTLTAQLGCGSKVRSFPILVLSHDGKPMPEATVTVQSGSARQSYLGHSLVTDSDGRAVIDSLATEGNVELQIDVADGKHRIKPLMVLHADIDKHRTVEVTLPRLPGDAADTVKLSDAWLDAIYILR